jgi:hypothetical protein
LKECNAGYKDEATARRIAGWIYDALGEETQRVSGTLAKAVREAIRLDALERSLTQLRQDVKRYVKLYIEERNRLDAIERFSATVHCNFTTPDAWTVTPTGPQAEDLEPIHGTFLRHAIDNLRRKWGQP